MKTWSAITGSGSYIPEQRIVNEDFLKNEFYGQNGIRIDKPNEEVIRQFHKITGILERRYVTEDQLTSDIAFQAGRNALTDADVDGETLDYIIVAHNFGDVRKDTRRSEFVPSLASRVKNHLNIANPSTVAYDLIFGCPGWLQGVMNLDDLIRAGKAKRGLIIGAETLSRIADPHDRDSMIYADGAGAIVVEATFSDTPTGILSHCAKSFTGDLTYVLKMGKSNNPAFQENDLFLKMDGHTLYENALKNVPKVIRETIDKAGLSISDIDKFLIHQANKKMDEAILQRTFAEYGIKATTYDVMPMTISWLGNSSVATLPTLYDLLNRGQLEHQAIAPGSILVFVSLGAGVNINAMVYRVPGK
ncbi:MAG TPA: ketoacyl-ACP synthase III [Chryseosolibacter sp.]|nr:ketoacyl-ACP synthase III [Chryseosolibacter sp.]